MDNNAESQQSAENKSAPKSDEDEQQLVAGRKPAGKLNIFHGNCTHCNHFIESKSIWIDIVKPSAMVLVSLYA